jgi:hypothetical protein
MNTRKLWITAALATVLVLAAGGAAALPGVTSPDAIVASKINYQGRLTDPGGAPLSGTFPMRFQVYDDPAAGTLLWDSGVINVDVDHGLFNVALAVDPANFNGQALWLRIYVDGEWLSPRQELLPVPYALSLRPGAIVQGEPTGWEGHVVRVNMEGAYPLGKAVWGTVSTGQAIRGDATGGYGLIGYTEEGYAVYGVDSGGAVARGYGGYFDSANGVGVYGHSNAPSYYTNMYAPGVYGRSAHGAGVYGLGDSTSWPGYGGYFEGRLGVGARSSGTSSQDGYAGSFVSENYRGIFVLSQGGWYDAYFAGIGGVYSAGGYWSLRADRTLVVNGSDETLEPGDVVALAGVVESPFGGEPLLAVRKADASHASAIVGVAVQAVRLEMKEVERGAGETLDVQPVEGNIPPQGYLAIVTGGLAPAVRVDAPSESLEIGDLLTVSSRPGRVQKAGASVQSDGTILGKVAGPVDVETGTVPVFVVLR